MSTKYINLLRIALVTFTLMALSSSKAQSVSNSVNKIQGQDIYGHLITISTTKTAYASGDLIPLVITLKNVGNTEFSVPHGSFARYELDVHYSDKNTVPLTSYGKKYFENKLSGSLAMISLAPGEEISNEIPLSRLFDFSVGANYEVSAKKQIIDPKDHSKWLDVVSNQIEFSVDGSFEPKVIK